MATGATFTLRPWRRSDLAAMTELVNARVLRDGEGESVTEASMAANYDHLTNCDPATDIVVAESAGTVVGYVRAAWEDVPDARRLYFVPMEARADVAGLDEALLRWGVGRAEAIAAGHDHRDQLVTVWAPEGSARLELIEQLGGFAVTSWSAILVRPHLDELPERALPEDVEVRAVEPSHLRAIYDADAAAFRGQHDFVEPTEHDWQRFLADEATHSELWQVAWDARGVVGQVRTYVVDGEAERRGRRRAWTESISTRADRRGQGVAAALIAHSLRQLARLGYDEVALGADYDNPHGALALYESLGYRVVQRRAALERPVRPT